jgi:hypothetical protein
VKSGNSSDPNASGPAHGNLAASSRISARGRSSSSSRSASEGCHGSRPDCWGYLAVYGWGTRRRPRRRSILTPRGSPISAASPLQLDGVAQRRRSRPLQSRYRGRLVARQLDHSHVVIRTSFDFRDFLPHDRVRIRHPRHGCRGRYGSGPLRDPLHARVGRRTSPSATSASAAAGMRRGDMPTGAGTDTQSRRTTRVAAIRWSEEHGSAWILAPATRLQRSRLHGTSRVGLPRPRHRPPFEAGNHPAARWRSFRVT